MARTWLGLKSELVFYGIRNFVTIYSVNLQGDDLSGILSTFFLANSRPILLGPAVPGPICLESLGASISLGP